MIHQRHACQVWWDLHVNFMMDVRISDWKLTAMINSGEASSVKSCFGPFFCGIHGICYSTTLQTSLWSTDCGYEVWVYQGTALLLWSNYLCTLVLKVLWPRLTQWFWKTSRHVEVSLNRQWGLLAHLRNGDSRGGNGSQKMRAWTSHLAMNNGSISEQCRHNNITRIDQHSGLLGTQMQSWLWGGLKLSGETL